MIENKICTWIGNDEGCRHPTIRGKSYCEKHYDRIYLTLPLEMAQYIIDKEIKETLQVTY